MLPFAISDVTIDDFTFYEITARTAKSKPRGRRGCRLAGRKTDLNPPETITGRLKAVLPLRFHLF